MGNKIGLGKISSEHEWDNAIKMEGIIAKQANIIDDLQYKLLELKTFDLSSTQQVEIMEGDHAQ